MALLFSYSRSVEKNVSTADTGRDWNANVSNRAQAHLTRQATAAVPQDKESSKSFKEVGTVSLSLLK